MKKNLHLTLGILTILSCFTGSSLAGTHTWSGAGGNALWSNAANWSSGGVPTAAEAAPVKLIFPANAVSRTSTLNISNLKIDAIEIDTSSGNYSFPAGGVTTTLTGAAGDNIKIVGFNDVTWLPTINLQSTCRFNVSTFNGTLDFQGIISGNGGITKLGVGELKFSTGGSANTFTGVMRIEAGILYLDKIVGTPCFGGNLEIVSSTVQVLRSHQIPDNATITMSAGTLTVTKALAAGNTFETVGPINVSGLSTINALTTNTFSFGGNVTCENNSSASLSVVAAAGAQVTFAGATRTFAVPHASSTVTITGFIGNGPTSAGIIKTGAGTLSLKGSNDLSGPFLINGGMLEISTPQGLGTGAGGTTIAAGATLHLPNIVLPAAESISLAGAITTKSGTGAEIQGNITLSGTPSLGSNSVNVLRLSGALSGNPTEVLIASGVVEYAGNSANTYTALTRILPGDAILALNKSFGAALTGNAQINYQGTLKLMKPHQINDGAAIFFGTGGTFDVNSQVESVQSISSLQDSAEPRVNLGDGALTVTGNSNYQFGFPTLTGRAYILGSSSASFRKQGSGTMVLVGIQTSDWLIQNLTLYVQNGILDLQGYWKSPIQVLGGLLKGTAQAGNVIVAGGDVAFDQFTLSGITNTGAGGKLIYALNGGVPGTGFPRATVTGALNLTGIQLQGSLDFVPRTDSSFMLIDNNGPGPVTGTFAGLPEGSTVMIGGQPFKISYQGGPEGKDVVLYFIGQGYGFPEIVSVTKLPDTSVQFVVKGMPNEAVTLQYNTNGLSGNWNTAKNMVLDASGNGTHIRWNSNLPTEFFRLRYTK